ncbi:MAG: hypothetical protein KQH53_01625 [Desulfarculaceae bacterium]|nr:hypothetical protein [Desulfarculaceae bacterium]
MNQADPFAADPSVRAMRAVFAALEAAEAELLGRSGLKAWDPRLRAWRQKARDAFEAAWPSALSQGLARQPEEAAALYLLCLGRLLTAGGLSLPEGALPEVPALAALLEKGS